MKSEMPLLKGNAFPFMTVKSRPSSGSGSSAHHGPGASGLHAAASVQFRDSVYFI
jgi:hypothetical protein